MLFEDDVMVIDVIEPTKVRGRLCMDKVGYSRNKFELKFIPWLKV